MSNFSPDQAQEKALASWYKEGNELRLEPRHPLIKLAGEAGEILDLYGKHEYKPEFSWWKCKHCGYGDASHDSYKRCPCLSKSDENILRGFYTPLILDELGDYSYYLRILTFQQEVSFEMLCIGYEPFTACLEELLNDLVYRSTRLHKKWLKFNTIDKMELQIITFIFLTILERLEVSLEVVLDLNYKKLNSDETQHGWNAAR